MPKACGGEGEVLEFVYNPLLQGYNNEIRKTRAMLHYGKLYLPFHHFTFQHHSTDQSEKTWYWSMAQAIRLNPRQVQRDAKRAPLFNSTNRRGIPSVDVPIFSKFLTYSKSLQLLTRNRGYQMHQEKAIHKVITGLKMAILGPRKLPRARTERSLCP